MDHQVIGDTSCKWRIQCSPERIGWGTEWLGNKKQSWYYPNYNIIDID